VGEVQAHDLPGRPKEQDASARDFAEQQLEKAGLRSRFDVVDALLRKCADNRSIAMEVEKLALYLGARKDVAVADVEAIVSSSRETAGWDLADHFGKRDLPAALRTLRQLLFQKESPHGMVAGLEGRIRDLIVLKECLNRRWARLVGSGDWPKVQWSGEPEADAALGAFEKDPRTINEWRVGKLTLQASGFSAEELNRCHRLAVETHEQMVSSPVPAEMLLELFLIKALVKVRNAAA
jgi:DNA polymerase III subunit delta